MANPRRSRRTFTILAVLVLLSVTIITLDGTGKLHGLTSGVRDVARDIFNPLRRGVDGIIDPIGRFFAGAVHYGSLEQENNHLRTELQTLEHQRDGTTYARQLQKSYTAASKQKTLTELKGFHSVVAAVYSGSTSNFADTITIDVGTGGGVNRGDPVLANGGLVGVISVANHTSATVQLLTTGNFEVGVVYGTDQDTSLDGQGAGKPLIATAVPSVTKVTPPDVMVTDNAHGAPYPAGIPVAKIAHVALQAGASDQTVTATPVADVANLSFVLVVQSGTGP